MATFKYPAEYRFESSGLVVLFTAHKTGTVIVADHNKTEGEFRTDWTGPENNPNWVLVPQVSTKRRLHEAVSKFKNY